MSLALLLFGNRSFFVVGAIRCVVGCWAVSAASTHYIQLAPSSKL